MASINKETAIKLVESNGQYSDDPPAHVVFEFVNSFNHQTSYGVCYNRSEFLAYLNVHAVTRIMWHAPEFDVLFTLAINGNFH